MGVEHKADLDGDHPVELFCTACETAYWTDEQSNKQCPSCGSYYDWEVTERQ